MTIPVNKLKVMAFSFSAAVGALGGALFAAQQSSVFPTNFTESILILIYACLVLGGAGSIAGAIAGGIIVRALEQMLSSPTDAGYLFYGLILLSLFLQIRPWRRPRRGARRRSSCLASSHTRSSARSRARPPPAIPAASAGSAPRSSTG